MKQHITVDQLNELTEEQKEGLREWWEPKFGDLLYVVIETDTAKEPIETVILDVNDICLLDDDNAYERNNCLPILSVGQMMELLRDYKAYDATTNDLLWTVEPCDVLWYDVKRTLEKGPAKCCDCGTVLNSQNATKEPGFCDVCWGKALKD